jgi:hypothetical protein
MIGAVFSLQILLYFTKVGQGNGPVDRLQSSVFVTTHRADIRVVQDL